MRNEIVVPQPELFGVHGSTGQDDLGHPVGKLCVNLRLQLAAKVFRESISELCFNVRNECGAVRILEWFSKFLLPVTDSDFIQFVRPQRFSQNQKVGKRRAILAILAAFGHGIKELPEDWFERISIQCFHLSQHPQEIRVRQFFVVGLLCELRQFRQRSGFARGVNEFGQVAHDRIELSLPHWRVSRYKSVRDV